MHGYFDIYNHILFDMIWIHKIIQLINVAFIFHAQHISMKNADWKSPLILHGISYVTIITTKSCTEMLNINDKEQNMYKILYDSKNEIVTLILYWYRHLCLNICDYKEIERAVVGEITDFCV